MSSTVKTLPGRQPDPTAQKFDVPSPRPVSAWLVVGIGCSVLLQIVVIVLAGLILHRVSHLNTMLDNLLPSDAVSTQISDLQAQRLVRYYATLARLGIKNVTLLQP